MYKPGRVNSVPDVLSLKPLPEVECTDLLPDHAILGTLNLRVQPLACLEDKDQLRKHQAEDPFTKRVMDSLGPEQVSDEGPLYNFYIQDGLVYFKDTEDRGSLHPHKCLQLVVPLQLR